MHEHRPASDRMEHLVRVGPHPCALASGEDDDRECRLIHAPAITRRNPSFQRKLESRRREPQHSPGGAGFGQLAGVPLGLADDRLRAPELERRLAEAPDLAAGRADFGFEAVLALAAGALRVAPDLRGADLVATGFDVDVTPVPPSSSAHLPDRTRCAASATASAISEPSLEALLIICVAAALALSAASIPASLIALRALGLAAIAAAAAVNPAASISRLIAALAILSK